MASNEQNAEALERIKEEMALAASHAMTATVNHLGGKWANYPIAGKDKALAILRGYTRSALGMAMVYLKADKETPTNWMQDPALALECSNVLVDQLVRELGLINPGVNYAGQIKEAEQQL